MPATPLAATERFIQPGVTKCYWLPTIAATNGEPTRAEITAGIDLTDEVAAAAGWMLSAAYISTPDLGSRFDKKIPGKTSVADSSISFWADKGGDDVRAELTPLQSGFIVWADGGDVTGYLASAYPVSVGSVGNVRDVAGGAGLMVEVGFAITGEPAENFALPATA